MSQDAVSISNLSFSYDTAPVLQDVDLQVQGGDFMAILGPNGGGKTTLLKLILGLLTPDAGDIRVFGLPPKQAQGRIGYVPQHAALQPSFPITVQEVALMGLKSARRPGFGYRKRDKDKALAALDRVGMAELAERRMDELSGGQRQRALVARALAGEPDLLIFDEPTANIDPQGKLCLYELLATLKEGITIMIVSHDLVVASVQVSAIAAVNKSCIASRGNRLTPDMLYLVYGAHKHTCPLDDLLQDPSAILQPVSERLHGHSPMHSHVHSHTHSNDEQ